MDHDVPDIDPNAKLHLTLRSKRSVRLCQGLLNGDRAMHGINDAGELCEHAVTRAPSDVPPSFSDEAVDNRAMRGQRGERRFLILVHEAAVALDIGRENGSKLALWRDRSNEGAFSSSMEITFLEARPKGAYR